MFFYWFSYTNLDISSSCARIPILLYLFLEALVNVWHVYDAIVKILINFYL